MSWVLAVKLFASPALIGLASLAGKRWGHSAAGLLGGLPLVGGPVVLALWIADGPDLAAQVVHAAPVGVWATIVYLLVLGHASARLPWFALIPVGWLSYLAAVWLLYQAPWANSLVTGIAVLPGLWIATTLLLPRPAGLPRPASLPRIELAARMAAALALVFGLTAAAAAIGPDYTGLLACAPVAASVIPAFTLANAGRDALLLALRGFLTGLNGFAVFFLVLGHSMPDMGALALLPATVAALAASYVAMRLLRLPPAAGPLNRRSCTHCTRPGRFP